MGPSIERMWGILNTRPDMLWLSLNPSMLTHMEVPGLWLVALGTVLTIINTRIIFTFGLLALPFFNFHEMGRLEKSIFMFCAFIFFCLEIWMMYQGFVLGWIA
jgi:hypothetical protein